MCIGIPMRVRTAEPGRASCVGRGGVRTVSTALVGACEPGEWLLVFLDTARERIDATRAAEIDATLDLLEHAMSGGAQLAPPVAPPVVPEGGPQAAVQSDSLPSAALPFTLPSVMTADQLAALVGRPEESSKG